MSIISSSLRRSESSLAFGITWSRFEFRLGGSATEHDPQCSNPLRVLENLGASGPFAALAAADATSGQNTATTEALGAEKLASANSTILIAAISGTTNGSYSR